MVTVLRISGLRIMIYTNDHLPPHVHVYGAGEARLEIETSVVMSNTGLSKKEIKAAQAAIAENREALMAQWREYHG